MKNNNTLYTNYHLTADGKLYKLNPTEKEIKKDNSNRFYLVSDCGIGKKITLKELYRQIYKKEFVIDTIKNLLNEEWKPIENTNGKYYISNYGRVKSLCGYKAKILQTYQNNKGYLIVKINNKNVFIHRLVAFAFCENNYKEQKKVEIHHKDFNKQNNHFSNLEILSITEHHKLHNKKEDKDNE